MEFQGILHTIFWELANLNICFTGDSFWLNQNEFYLRRLHSLLGIIPIGAFLIVHLLVNHQATQGAEAFNKASGFMESLPFLIVVEFLLIYIPLLYHGLFGLHIAFTAKENIGHYSLFRNWMFFFQRVSGILAFIFIAMHLWQTRLQKAFFGKAVDYDMMHETLKIHYGQFSISFVSLR